MPDIHDVINLDHVFELYVPTQCICGEPIQEEYRNNVFKDVKELFSAWFGGYSVSSLQGGWRLPDGTLAEEPVDVLRSGASDEAFDQRLEDIKNLAVTVADKLTQDRVLITIDGRLSLYPRSDPLHEKCTHSLDAKPGITDATLSKPGPQPLEPRDVEKMRVIYSALSGFSSLTDARHLFNGTLNYKLADGLLPCGNWPESAKRLVKEIPQIIADVNGFRIVYIRLDHDKLLRGQERAIIKRIVDEDPSFCGMFIVTNLSRDKWVFVNVRSLRSNGSKLILRRMRVGKGETVRTATERLLLVGLSAQDETLSAKEVQEKHNEAFNVEKVTEAFFHAYVSIFRKLKKYLLEGTKSHKDVNWAHEYALQFLNRTMFVYFIQKKGWIGSQTDFLQHFWSEYSKTTKSKDVFCSHWLSVLFFEAFNNKFKAASANRAFLPHEIRSSLAEAPYLNGGLFTENEKDEKFDKYKVTITDFLFKEILDFFGHYNFTIAEESPLDVEIAVDPEMIGKVYESLVNVSDEIDERGQAGIFYTPRIEIALMCRLALVDCLSNHLQKLDKKVLYEFVFALENEEKAEADKQVTLSGVWTELDRELDSITICDPACGSGSFLIGMLDLLGDLRHRINQQFDRQEDDFTIKKHIINRSLYGVDIMQWAVEVCELRLWLQLVVDADLRLEERQFKPLLPNLTFKIRQGDSLIQEIAGVNMTLLKGSRELSDGLKKRISKLRKAKLSFYDCQDQKGAATRKRLEDTEYAIFQSLVNERRENLQKRLKELKAVQKELLEPEPSAAGYVPTGKVASETRLLEAQVAVADQALGALQSVQSPKAFFVWDIAFVEVFHGEKGGFDIVVGNPPYVRQEKIADPGLPQDSLTKENKKAYRDKLIRSVYLKYPGFFGGNPDKPNVKLSAKNDLYIYFYLHGLSLVSPRGSFCFVTSNSWLDAGYGAVLQEFLLRRTRVKLIIDNQSYRSFESAGVNTVIVLFSAPSAQPQSLSESNEMARFVLCRVPFEQILSSIIFEEIDSSTERKETPEYRVLPMRQDKLLEEGYELSIHDEGPRMDVPRRDHKQSHSVKVGKYRCNKWGGKYLRAPDIYWQIICRNSASLVQLSRICSIEGYIHDNNTGHSFERVPFLKSVKDTESILVSRTDPGVVQFGVKKSGNSRLLAPILFPRTLGYRHVVVWNRDGVFGKEFYKIIPNSTQIVLPIAAQMNSTFAILQRELLGLVNLGEGAIKFSANDVGMFLVLPNISTPHLSSCFQDLAERPQHNIVAELQLSDRKALDDVIFEALGLSCKDREEVYNAVRALVQNRMNKASSV